MGETPRPSLQPAIYNPHPFRLRELALTKEGGQCWRRIVDGDGRGCEAQSQSKQMLEIVKRLEASGDFAITVFSDHTILHEPIEDWPVVQALISFYSDQPFKDSTDKQDERKEEKAREHEVLASEKQKAGPTEEAAGAAEERKEVPPRTPLPHRRKAATCLEERYDESARRRPSLFLLLNAGHWEGGQHLTSSLPTREWSNRLRPALFATALLVLHRAH